MQWKIKEMKLTHLDRGVVNEDACKKNKIQKNTIWLLFLDTSMIYSFECLF